VSQHTVVAALDRVLLFHALLVTSTIDGVRVDWLMVSV
jgi:hypothetical protein